METGTCPFTRVVSSLRSTSGKCGGETSSSGVESRRPPGPGRKSFLKQLFSQADPIDSLVDNAAEFGPIYQINTLRGTVNVVSVELGRELLRDHYPQRIDRREVFAPFAEQVGADVFSVTGSEHQCLRGMLRFGYSRHIVSQFVPQIAEAMADRIRAWPRGTDFPFLDAASDLAARGAALCITPVPLEPHLERLAKPANVIMHVQMGQWSPLRLQSPIYRRRWRSATRLLESVAQRHLDGEFSDRPDTWLLDALAMAKGPNGETLTLPQMRGAAWFALAGHQIYTSRVATGMLYGLCRNRALYDAVRQEVDEAFGQGRLEAPTVRRMAALRRTYLESLRAFPLLPGMALRVRAPLEVRGYELRAGDKLLVDTVSGHYLAESYTNPFDFDAGRSDLDRTEHRSPGAFQPFGLPPRSCLASGAVELLAMTLVATVLRQADLRLARPTWRPRLCLNPLIAPRDGMPVRLVRLRDPGPASDAPRGILETPSVDSALAAGWDIESKVKLLPRDVDAGAEVVRQGETAETFYVVLSGIASVLKSHQGSVTRVATLRGGDSFGEIGLIKNIPRTATVVAETRMRLLEVPRASFMRWVAEGELSARELGSLLLERYVRSALLSALPELDASAAHWASPEVEQRHYRPGEIVLRQGAPAFHLYFLTRGELEVLRIDREGGMRRVNVIKPGQFFGEIGLLHGKPRSATVRALRDQAASVLRVSRDDVEHLMRDRAGVREDVLSVMCRRLLKSLA